MACTRALARGAEGTSYTVKHGAALLLRMHQHQRLCRRSRNAAAGARRLTGAGSPGEVCHITIDHGGKLPYWEGQSLNVVPPGVDANGKPHKVSAFSATMLSAYRTSVLNDVLSSYGCERNRCKHRGWQQAVPGALT
jgi:hypothetical protein